MRGIRLSGSAPVSARLEANSRLRTSWAAPARPARGSQINELHPGDPALPDALRVMCELREHRTLDDLLEMYQEGYCSGYRLAALHAHNQHQAVAGYRFGFNFAMGSYLYVDDLVTREEMRSNGFGSELLDHLVGVAAEKDCDFVVLDSGIQRERAHKFYERQRLTVTAYHFTLPLNRL